MTAGESMVEKVVNGETSKRSRTRDRSAICYEYHDPDEGEDVRVRIDPSTDPSDSGFIQRSDPNNRAYNDPLPDLPLPGSGDVLEDCGEEIPALYCQGCAKPYEVGRTCRRSRCPRCWQSWAFQRAKSIAAKLQTLAIEHGMQKDGVFKHHLTVSVRDSTRFNSKDPLNQGFEAVKSLLAKVDVKTGYLAYHPYRIVPEYRGSVLGHESGEGDYTWKDVLEKVESEDWSWEAVRDEFLIYAPHYHVIGISEFAQCGAVTEQIENETGAVIHRITTERKDGKKKSIANLEELCKVTAYSLSHAGLGSQNGGESHRTAVRPFGEVANKEAWDGVKADVNETMREVAGTVLGIEFPEPECTERVHQTEDGHNHSRTGTAAPAHGSGGSGSRDADAMLAHVWAAADAGFYNDDTGSWDASTGAVPSDVTSAPKDQHAPCGGQLAPMWTVETCLNNLKWISEIEETYSDGEDRLRDLRQAYQRWDDMGRLRPVGVGDGDLEDDPPPD